MLIISYVCRKIRCNEKSWKLFGFRGELDKALVAWKIWKERNARIFDRCLSTAEALITKIKEEARPWCAAGAKKTQWDHYYNTCLRNRLVLFFSLLPFLYGIFSLLYQYKLGGTPADRLKKNHCSSGRNKTPWVATLERAARALVLADRHPAS